MQVNKKQEWKPWSNSQTRVIGSVSTIKKQPTSCLRGQGCEDVLLLSSIDFWHSSYVPRSCNSTAHNIAKWALFCNASGTIPISSLPAHVLAKVAERSGSPIVFFSLHGFSDFLGILNRTNSLSEFKDTTINWVFCED